MIRAIGKRLFGASGASPDARSAGARSAREGELERIVARMSAIGSMILADAASRDIFDAMVRGIVEDSGADFVVLRIAKPGGDVFEMKACAGLGDVPVEPRHSLSVSRTTFLSLCGGGEPLADGFVVEAGKARAEPDSPVPRCAESPDGKMLLAGIEENGAVAGFFTIGFFDGAPDERLVSQVKLYRDRVLLVQQRERAKEQLRDKERSLAI